MTGPIPKPDTIRQRQNKKSTRAVLAATSRQIAVSKTMPAHPLKEKWHPLARAFWVDVWASPMASQYLEADLHGLFRMLVLTDRFMKEPSVSVSAELRLLSQLYGLSPIDRRRLEWTVAKTEDAVQAVEQRRTRRARNVTNDPREVLDQ